MADRIVLVHSPLVGVATWRPLGVLLSDAGLEIAVPDLGGSLTSGPPYWPRQVEAVVESARGQPAILVGHSGAGPLFAAAGNALASVKGYIFVDAGLPTMGQSWLQTVPTELAAFLLDSTEDGMIPPWPTWLEPDELTELLPAPALREAFVADCPYLPLAMFEEIQPYVPEWPNAPGAYLRLSEAYEESAAQASALGWPTIVLASHHLALFSEPRAVLGPLMDLIRQLEHSG